MEKFDATFFYYLGSFLKELINYKYNPNDRFSLFIKCLPVQVYCDMAFKEFRTLTISKSSWDELKKQIENIGKWIMENTEDERNKENKALDYSFESTITKAKNFETIFLAELQTLNLYKVTQKGIYSSPDLIEHAEKIFPKSILSRMNNYTIIEVRESGRCLAFDNPTASAFHIIRATEAVLHEYYIKVCKPESKEKLANWSAYISELYKSTDIEVKEVVAMLQQFKDRHRNLIMHPEIVLTPDESFTLFEMAQGVIIAMASKLNKITRRLRK